MDEAAREAWNARYLEAERLWIGDPDPSLVRIVERVRPRTAIDLGAGEGRNALWLAAQGVETVAVDLSDVALERLAREAADRGLSVEVRHATIEEVAETEQRRFELVLLANIHPPAPARAALHRRAFGLVAAGGRLVIIGHHRSGFGIAGPPDPDRLLDEEEIRVEFPAAAIEALEIVADRADHGHHAPSLVAVVRREN
jgi:SAM-dependent methyltransferase